MTATPTRGALARFKPLFPDALDVLARGEAVRIKQGECYLCGAKEAHLVQMRSKDEWRCASDDGCGRRLRRRG